MPSCGCAKSPPCGRYLVLGGCFRPGSAGQMEFFDVRRGPAARLPDAAPRARPGLELAHAARRPPDRGHRPALGAVGHARRARGRATALERSWAEPARSRLGGLLLGRPTSLLAASSTRCHFWRSSCHARTGGLARLQGAADRAAGADRRRACGRHGDRHRHYFALAAGAAGGRHQLFGTPAATRLADLARLFVHAGGTRSPRRTAPSASMQSPLSAWSSLPSSRASSCRWHVWGLAARWFPSRRSPSTSRRRVCRQRHDRGVRLSRRRQYACAISAGQGGRDRLSAARVAPPPARDNASCSGPQRPTREGALEAYLAASTWRGGRRAAARGRDGHAVAGSHAGSGRARIACFIDCMRKARANADERHFEGDATGETAARDAHALSIVIPAKDEEESLPLVVARIIAASAASGQTLRDIVLVDDGSSDNTWEVMSKLAADGELMQAIRLRRNFGKATALMVGIGACRGDVIITMDADLQDDPDEIARFVETLDLGYDLVSGWKKERHDPLNKTLPSRLLQQSDAVISGVEAQRFQLRLQGLPPRDLRCDPALWRAAPLRARAGQRARLSHRRDPGAPPRPSLRHLQVRRGTLPAWFSRPADGGADYPLCLSTGPSVRRHRHRSGRQRCGGAWLI